MKPRRVVITGLGALTPIGNTLTTYWEGLLSGTSGAGPISYFDPSLFKTQFACELKNFNPLDHFDRKESRKYDRFAQYALVSVAEAIEDAKLPLETIDKDRVGVIWGAGIGGLETFQNEVLNFAEGNQNPRFNPFFIPKMIADIAPGLISIKYGFRGPNFATVSACASASNAMIDALNYIRLGFSDVIVTGGSEAAVTKAGIGGFNAMHALSKRNDDPKTASRPFDKDRDGFVLGEGAGALILESYEHAVNRGATIYAELAGGGLSADAHHMTAPHPEGLGAIKVMENCLKDAEINATEVDIINMHGTSTPLGDIAESNAIVKVFEDHAYKMNINSTKSMTGHLLGAAGAIEAIASIMSIKHSVVPPTINHTTPDEGIDQKINFTFGKSQKRTVNIALSNTFGFGGHNACVLFKKIKLN
jgi:3-oxoacyl-[acyl-carrier-protein] synthase II